MNKLTVLFVCTHNSSRSQMAEGLLKHLYGGYYDVYSAGTQPGGVSPFAILAMEEIGIDIQSHSSKNIHEFLSMNLDTVVTVCDSAREACPFVPAGNNIHQRFEDPRATNGSDAEKLATFRRVRKQIHHWVEDYFRPSPS